VNEYRMSIMKATMKTIEVVEKLSDMDISGIEIS
jgi:hypothetical protein